MRVAIRVFMLLGLCFLFTLPAFADAVNDKAGPDKAGLIAFWEADQKNDPHVSLFEKTKDAGVYNFATDFFPYKGRLRLLNAVVTKSGESYLDGLYTGIVEVELMDAPVDFLKKYAASYGAWVQQNYFYYDSKKAVWFPVSEWSSHSADLYKSEVPTGQGCRLKAALDQALFTWLPVVLLLLVLALAVRVARKQNRKVWDSHEKVLEGQRKSLAMAEENLALQREHTQLLRDIASALKK